MQHGRRPLKLDASYPAAKDAHRARLRQLSRLAFCVRHFYALAASHAPGLARTRDVQAAARALAPALDAVAAQLDGPAPPAAGLAQPGVSEAELPPPGEAAGSAPGPDADADARPVRLACQWLAEVDDLLRDMQGISRAGNS